MTNLSSYSLGRHTASFSPCGRILLTSLLLVLILPPLRTQVFLVRGESTVSSPLNSCSNIPGRDRELKEDYENLLSVNIRLHDVLPRTESTVAAKLLQKGRDSFRHSEVHSVAKEIAAWPTGYSIPVVKVLRGVSDEVCGRLLCSPSRDWDNPS